MKITLASLLSAAASAFGFLAQHDSTGTLANPASTLEQKASVLEPTLAAAGTDIVEQGLAAKLGPAGAAVGEMAIPLLKQIVAAATAKIDTLGEPDQAPA